MKKWETGFLITLLFLGFTTPCWSGEHRITLDEVIRETLQSNPSIRAYERHVTQANLNINVAKTTRWGELTGGAAIHRSEDDLMVSPITPRKMRQGIDFDKTRWGFNLTYRFPLYLGGKIPLAIDISRLYEASTRLALKRLNAVIRHRVTELYLAILSLEGEEKAAKENLKALNSVLRHTELTISQGKTAPVDKYKITYSIRRWEAIETEVHYRRAALLVALQSLMGRESVVMSLELSPVTIPQKITLLKQDIHALYTLALRNRSDLEAEKKKVRITGKKVDLARTDRMPSLFAVGVFESYDASSASFEEEWDASLQLKIPLFDAGRRKTRVESAKVGLLEEKMRQVELQQAIIKQVGDAVTKVKTAEALTKSFLARVDLEREVDRVETIKYENGAGDIDDMLRAKAELAYSKSKWVASLYRWLTARSYLSLVLEEDVK